MVISVRNKAQLKAIVGLCSIQTVEKKIQSFSGLDVPIKSNNYWVYIHTNETNGKKYVGLSSAERTSIRWKNGRGYRECSYFGRAIEKYGWSSFSHEIVATNLTKEDAETLEIELIKKLETRNPNKGYNISLGGESGNVGECNGFYGKTHTDEYKADLRKRMSGSNNPNSKRVAQIDIDTGEIIAIFDTITEAHQKTGVNLTSICSATKGKLKAPGGFKWKNV